MSSGILKNPTYTMEKMCETLLLLRTKYHFNSYIHIKTIPGASDELLAAAGYLADRISVNLELPTEEGLHTLAPNKTMQNIHESYGKRSRVRLHLTEWQSESQLIWSSGGNKFFECRYFF